jgi:hypothetical protein
MKLEDMEYENVICLETLIQDYESAYRLPFRR